jgi:hypothetical protein
MRPLPYIAMLGALLVGAVASCIYPVSGQPTEDGGAVICVKVEPPPDAGAPPEPGMVSPAPVMRYVPMHAPVGTVVTPAASAP